MATPQAPFVPLAAIRIAAGNGYPETWSFTSSQKDILDRPDEEVIWETDPEGLQAILHQRTGGTDNYTFAYKFGTHHDGRLLHPAIRILTKPVWTGPLNVKEIATYLQKHKGSLQIPITTGKPNSPVGLLLKNLKKLPLWEDFEESCYGSEINSPCKVVSYLPGAGKQRREQEKYAQEYKEERRRWAAETRESQKRYNIDLRNESFGLLAKAYFEVLKNCTPQRGTERAATLKEVVSSCSFVASPKSTCTRMRKNKLVETVCFLIGMLRMMGDPHHRGTGREFKALHSALKVFRPRLGQLKKMVSPYSRLGKLLDVEMKALNLG